MTRYRLLLLSLLIVSIPLSAQDKGPKFSGLMFGDYFYNINSTSGSKDFNGFQLRRIYITADYNVAENVSSRFRLEGDQGSGSLTPGGKAGVMIKDAWLKWKDLFSGSDLIFGISPTPAFDVSEGLWGNRYLEKTPMDLFGIVPSRDLGIDLKGKLTQNGSIKYWAKVGNNSGNAPEKDKYKRYYGLLEFNLIPNLVVTVYSDYASQPKKENKSNNTYTGAGFISYKQKGQFSVGLETFLRSQQNNYTQANGSVSSQNGFGISVWAYANLTENIQAVARFDNFDPNTDSNSRMDATSLILAGLDFKAANNFTVTPNIEVFTYQKDFPAGSDKNDIVPRVTFFWEF